MNYIQFPENYWKKNKNNKYNGKDYKELKQEAKC